MVLNEPRAITAMAPSSIPQRPNRDNLRPTLRGPPRLDGTADDELQTQQAGRSATNLNAQASAQTFREASRSTARDSRHTRPPPVQHNVSAAVGPPPLAAPQRLQCIVSPHAPAISSPLNPTPSNSSSARESRKDSDTSVEISIRAPSPELPGRRAVGGDGTAGMPGEQTISNRSFLELPDASSRLNSTTSLSRLSTPRSVRDLGTDYTRYFNPFATQNSSEQDLSSSLPSSPPTPAVPTADLVKRLSNPFKDDKRISGLYEPVEETSAPKPPIPRRRNTDEDRIAVAIAAAPSTRAGTPTFIHDADPEKAHFFSYMDDRFGAPCAFPLYNDQQEDDDDMHMPRWDDDKRYTPRLKDRFSRENLINTLGMILLILGLGVIFVVLPVVSFTGTNLIPYPYETPAGQTGGGGDDFEAWAHVNDNVYPLLANVRTGLIDPDTPDSAMTRQGVDGETLKLVFSDEFNQQNRTFYPGDDPYWFAPDIWYGATQDMEWYDPDAVNTGTGTLQVQLDNFTNHGLGFRSGMLNSWNQLCFKGGKFEVSMSLPGPAGVHGLWPGAWTMGNLGRPGYTSTTDGVWPYTYNSCDAGITPNQSATDGMNWLPGQRLSSCSCADEDHPTPGTGRGAPEIDIVEVSADWAGNGFSVATQSFQVAPFDIFYFPNYEYMETPNYQFSFVNTYTGGPFQQAVSTTTMLNNDWYDGKAYQKYSFEYTPGGGKDAGIAWFVGDDEMMRFDGRAIGQNGNVQERLVSEEPMSMIINLGFSHSWVNIDWDGLKFPTVLQVDYVRWYQPANAEIVTCDPPGYETTDYIKKHPMAYQNPNLTKWEDTGYSWPKNTLMHGCSAS